MGPVKNTGARNVSKSMSVFLQIKFRPSSPPEKNFIDATANNNRKRKKGKTCKRSNIPRRRFWSDLCVCAGKENTGNYKEIFLPLMAKKYRE